MTSVATGGPIDSLPTKWRALAWVGAPLGICAFLLFFVTNVISARLDAIDKTLSERAKVETDHLVNEKLVVEQNWQLIGMIQQVCLNISKTNEEKLNCLSRKRPQ